jgi:uncharacterized CHY-type Zn-finger protein
MEKKVETRQGIVMLSGYLLDDQTRCIHYHSEKDVIAIRFKCCGVYYPCYECHTALAGHEAKPWPKTDHNQLAILCGVCKNQLTIEQYLNCGYQCPYCGTSFNPNCSKHYYLYFAP